MGNTFHTIVVKILQVLCLDELRRWFSTLLFKPCFSFMNPELLAKNSLMLKFTLWNPGCFKVIIIIKR